MSLRIVRLLSPLAGAVDGAVDRAADVVRDVFRDRKRQPRERQDRERQDRERQDRERQGRERQYREAMSKFVSSASQQTFPSPQDTLSFPASTRCSTPPASTGGRPVAMTPAPSAEGTLRRT